MTKLSNIHKKRDIVAHNDSYLILGLTSCWRVNESTYKLINDLPSRGTRSEYVEVLKKLGCDRPDEILESLRAKGLLQEATPFFKNIFEFFKAPKIRLLKGSWLSFVAQPKLLRYVFSPIFIYTTFFLLLSIMALAALGSYEASPDKLETGWTWPALAGILAGVAFHEIGHSLACSYVGIGCRPVGITWYLLWPVAFTNVSGSSLLTKKQRLLVDVSGIYFQAWIMIPLFFMNIFWPYYGFQSAFKLLSYLILFNLNPFIGSDSYWFFQDILSAKQASPAKRIIELFYQIGFTIFTGYLVYRVGTDILTKLLVFFKQFGAAGSVSTLEILSMLLLSYIQVLILIGIGKRLARILKKPDPGLI